MSRRQEFIDALQAIERDRQRPRPGVPAPAPWTSATTSPRLRLLQPTPAPELMSAHQDPAIREAQARIYAASQPHPQALFGSNKNPFDPQSVAGQMADVGHQLIRGTTGAEPFGPESPGAYTVADVGQQGLLQRLHGRYQPMESKEGIAMPVGGGEALGVESALHAGAAEEEANLLRTFGRMKQFMRPEAAAGLRKDIQKNIAEAWNTLPPTEEWEAAARAGVAKRGWYKNSGAAIRQTFGDDTPTFTAILAAQSPRQGVAENLKMAIRTFGEWVAAGRPEDEAGIKRVLEKVPGATFPSRVPNTIRAIQGHPLVDFTDPSAGGAGYKVESFRRNLLGEMDYATNDTWQAKFIGQTGDFFGNKSNYLAADARTRQVAKKMGWSTAEVQETIWSWVKTLIEQTPSSSTLREGLKGVTHELIGQDADFASLLRDPDVLRRLEQYGYRPPAAVAGEGSAGASQAIRPGTQEADPRVLSRIARRLERRGIEPVGAAAKAGKP